MLLENHALDPCAVACLRLRSVITSQLNPLTSILSCSPAAVLTLRQDTLNTLNLPAWRDLMATAQQGVADIYPGKWTRCAGRVLARTSVRRSLRGMMGSDLQRQRSQSYSDQWWPGLRRRTSA